MLANHYRAQRGGLIELVQTADATGSEAVPACPGWSVSNVIGHLTGLADNWITGDLEVYASPAWTQKQIDSWSSAPLADVLGAWVESGDQLAEVLDHLHELTGLPETIMTIMGPQPTATFGHGILIDLTLHCYDVASALDRELPDHLGTVPMLTTVLTRTLHRVWKHHGHSSIAIASREGGELGVLGGGQPTATLTASTLELFRLMGGRRTVQQIRSLDWAPSPPDDEVLADLVVGYFAVPPAQVEASR